MLDFSKLKDERKILCYLYENDKTSLVDFAICGGYIFPSNILSAFDLLAFNNIIKHNNSGEYSLTFKGRWHAHCVVNMFGNDYEVS
jgi:hypothetical protein